MGKVIIIDDESEFITMISLKLKKVGIESLGYENAKEALEYLKSDKDKVDTLVVDLLMPEMSGWVFIDEMKKAGIDKIPVIILTNLAYTDVPKDTGIDLELLVKTDISMKELVAVIKEKSSK